MAQIVGQALKQRTGHGIVNQSLAYLMRAGAPVALDRMVATAFGTMAVQSLAAGEAGLMMALHNGNYETVPIETCIQGEKRVDVDELYDADASRPVIRNVRGKPMYLY